ncbi:MAG: LPS assembly lipoprotein LptE [Flavobacteriales bacterium]
MLNNKKIAMLCFMLLALLMDGCRVSYKLSDASVPEDAKSASVAMFINSAPLANPNLSQLLTEGLKDVIQNQSRLFIINSQAHLQFAGNITAYDIRPVAIQGDETAGLNRLTVTLQVEYTNTLDEKKSFRQNFTRFSDFPSDKELNSVEDQLNAEIVKQLTQDIFDKAFSNW